MVSLSTASSPASVWPHLVPVSYFLSSEFGILEMWAKGEYQEWLAWDPEREVEVNIYFSKFHVSELHFDLPR